MQNAMRYNSVKVYWTAPWTTNQRTNSKEGLKLFLSVFILFLSDLILFKKASLKNAASGAD